METTRTNRECAIEMHRLAGEVELCRDQHGLELAAELRAIAAQLEQRPDDSDGTAQLEDLEAAALELLDGEDADDDEDGEFTRVEVTIRIAVDVELTGDDDELAVRDAAVTSIEENGLDRDHIDWAIEDATESPS